MKALVVDCIPRHGASKNHYNLGARKLANWLRSEGHDVTEVRGDVPGLFQYGYDLVALSVVFSWYAGIARDIALRVKGNAEVWCGGPGMTGLERWWKDETGLSCKVGLDDRFERQPGDYKMTFASRGCPVGCYFCIVPTLEGRTFTLYHDFTPAPMLCDNNLSALPVDFQEHIIRRYEETGVRLLDANSGFEPKAFDGDTFARWKRIIRGRSPWRFAFDEMAEAGDVERMMGILRGVPSRSKRVYVLVGNEPIASCYERAMKVKEWGGEPYCQSLIRVNSLTKEPWIKHDWTSGLLRDFCRYWNCPQVWRKTPIAEYSDRKGEPPPFRGLLSSAAA